MSGYNSDIELTSNKIVSDALIDDTVNDKVADMSDNEEDHMDTKLQHDAFANMMEKFKAAIFGTLAVMSKDMQQANWKTYVLLLIDFIQLMAFPFSLRAQFPWNEQYLNWFRQFMDIFDLNNYIYDLDWAVIVLYSLTFGGVTMILSLAIFVGYTVSTDSNFQSILMLKTLRSVAPLFVSSLFIPILKVFVSVLTCPYADSCSSGFPLIVRIVTTIEAVMFVVFAFFVAATFFDASPMSRDLRARSHTHADMVYLTFRCLVVIVFGFWGQDGKNHALLLLVMFGGGLASGYAFMKFIPYYNFNFSRFRLAMITTFIWASFMCLISVIYNNPNDGAPVITLFLCYPLVVLLTYYAAAHRRKLLKAFPIDEAKTIFEVELKVQFFMQEALRSLRQRVGVFNREIAEKDEIFQEQVELAREAYSMALELPRFSSSAELYLFYFRFIMNFCQDKDEAALMLAQAERCDSRLDQEFIIFLAKKQVQAELRARQEENQGNKKVKESSDAIGMIAKKHRKNEAQEALSNALVEEREFWKELLKEQPDSGILQTHAIQYHRELDRCRTALESLLKMDGDGNEDPDVLEMYGRVLIDRSLDRRRGVQILTRAKRKRKEKLRVEAELKKKKKEKKRLKLRELDVSPSANQHRRLSSHNSFKTSPRNSTGGLWLSRHSSRNASPNASPTASPRSTGRAKPGSLGLKRYKTSPLTSNSFFPEKDKIKGDSSKDDTNIEKRRSTWDRSHGRQLSKPSLQRRFSDVMGAKSQPNTPGTKHRRHHRAGSIVVSSMDARAMSLPPSPILNTMKISESILAFHDAYIPQKQDEEEDLDDNKNSDHKMNNKKPIKWSKQQLKMLEESRKAYLKSSVDNDNMNDHIQPVNRRTMGQESSTDMELPTIDKLEPISIDSADSSSSSSDDDDNDNDKKNKQLLNDNVPSYDFSVFVRAESDDRKPFMKLPGISHPDLHKLSNTSNENKTNSATEMHDDIDGMNMNIGHGHLSIPTPLGRLDEEKKIEMYDTNSNHTNNSSSESDEQLYQRMLQDADEAETRVSNVSNVSDEKETELNNRLKTMVTHNSEHNTYLLKKLRRIILGIMAFIIIMAFSLQMTISSYASEYKSFTTYVIESQRVLASIQTAAIRTRTLDLWQRGLVSEAFIGSVNEQKEALKLDGIDIDMKTDILKGTLPISAVSQYDPKYSKYDLANLLSVLEDIGSQVQLIASSDLSTKSLTTLNAARYLVYNGDSKSDFYTKLNATSYYYAEKVDETRRKEYQATTIFVVISIVFIIVFLFGLLPRNVEEAVADLKRVMRVFYGLPDSVVQTFYDRVEKKLDHFRTTKEIQFDHEMKLSVIDWSNDELGKSEVGADLLNTNANNAANHKTSEKLTRDIMFRLSIVFIIPIIMFILYLLSGTYFMKTVDNGHEASFPSFSKSERINEILYSAQREAIALNAYYALTQYVASNANNCSNDRTQINGYTLVDSSEKRFDETLQQLRDVNYGIAYGNDAFGLDASISRWSDVGDLYFVDACVGELSNNDNCHLWNNGLMMHGLSSVLEAYNVALDRVAIEQTKPCTLNSGDNSIRVAFNTSLKDAEEIAFDLLRQPLKQSTNLYQYHLEHIVNSMLKIRLYFVLALICSLPVFYLLWFRNLFKRLASDISRAKTIVHIMPVRVLAHMEKDLEKYLKIKRLREMNEEEKERKDKRSRRRRQVDQQRDYIIDM